MGLSNLNYYISILLTELIYVIILSLMIVVILRYRNALSDENVFGFGISLVLFGISMTSFCMLISVFSSSKVSTYIGTLICFGFMFIEINKFGSLDSLLE